MINNRLKFLVVFFSLCVWQNINATTFDSSLANISKLQHQKSYATLSSFLQKSQASNELEDLRLFLLADSLKNQGNKAEAIKVYEKLFDRFPERETASQARLSYFLLLLENASESDLPKLEALARTLPTSWQRGTAFEKLAALKFVKPVKMSRLILMALRAYHSDKPFYKKVAASHSILKTILAAPENFVFDSDEWLEILVLCAEEGLLKDAYPKKKQLFARLLGIAGTQIAQIFSAIASYQAGKPKEALKILTAVIEKTKNVSLVKPFAYQERAYIHYQEKNYLNAIDDYRRALENTRYPVNSRACRYRLMRSAFFAGQDSKSLEMLNQLVKTSNPEPLLPIHIYEMGLQRYDAGNFKNAKLFFMILVRNFPGHYRADDALGYTIIAIGKNTTEGKTLLKLLETHYVNSFFLTWIAPKLSNKPLKSSPYKKKQLSANIQNRIKAWRKLWKTDFASFAREEARKMTDKYPANMPLYQQIIEVCRQNNDYSQLTSFAERLARQLLEAGKSLADMPLWAWKAYYPKAYLKLVNVEAKKNAIDPYWVLSIMREESHFNPKTLSRSNAHGLMQILPSTGKWIAKKLGYRNFKKNDLWKPEVNIKFGCWYLKYLTDLFNGELHLASAAYNGGQGNIQRKVENGPFAKLPLLDRLDRIPMPETRDYYKKVMGSYWNYQRLYRR